MQTVFAAKLIARTGGPIQLSPLAHCEAILSTPFKDLTPEQAPLSSVRQLIHILQAKAGRTQTDGTSYSVLSIAEDLETLSRSKAGTLIRHLTGLEEGLTSAGDDPQIFAVEIRGKEAIMQGRERLLERMSQLKPIYDELEAKGAQSYPEFFQRMKRWRWAARGGMMMSIPTLVYAAIIHDPLIYCMASAVCFVTATPSLAEFLVKRSKRTLEGSAKFLSALDRVLGSEPSPSPVVVWASKSNMMTSDLHRSIFNGEPDEQARIDAHIIKSSLIRSIAFLQLEEFGGETRWVREAGNPWRDINVDHILYFDPERKEPVWIIAYRAYSNRPKPRKPNPVERDTRREEIEVPGMRPAHVIAR